MKTSTAGSSKGPRLPVYQPEQLWDLYVQVTQREAEIIAKTGRIPDDVRCDLSLAAAAALAEEKAEKPT